MIELLFMSVKKTGNLLPQLKLLLFEEMPALVQKAEIRKYSWKVMAVMNKLSPKEDQILFLPKLKESPKPISGE